MKLNENVKDSNILNDVQETVLITGGSGLVGTRLTEILLEQGYKVMYLSRSKRLHDNPKVIVYQWNLETGYIDSEALFKADYIINLAGSSVADGRWTAKRKKEILYSRTRGLEILYKELKRINKQPKALISASGVACYGINTGEQLIDEQAKIANDFLASVVVSWEQATQAIERMGVRTVKLRIGVVLSGNGGALPKIAQPIRLGVGGKLGSGKQYMSWIHIDDLCHLFIFCIKNKKVSGVFNAVSSHPVTNKQFTNEVAKTLNRAAFLPVPAFVIKLLFGEMASVVLGGNNVSSKKIQEQGFKFQFPTLSQSLVDLLN